MWTSCLSLLLLQLIHQRVQALSSSSPRDLFASPAFEVVLNRELLSNDTARDLLDAQPDGAVRYELMRTSGGQGFVCSVPIIAKPAVNAVQPKRVHDERPKDAFNATAGLEKGLALLEPLKGGCLYQKQGWFTYAFCHGSEIRQFHEVRVQGSNVPAEDPRNDAYTLGFYPTQAIDDREHVSPEAAEVVASQATGGLPDILASPEDSQDLDAFSSKRYLVQRWGGGTVCDMTGLERKVEVQFHCNTQSTDRIALIRETALCAYVVVIHTARLCSEPYFLGSSSGSSSSEPSHQINCRPIARKPSTLEPAEAAASSPSAQQPTALHVSSAETSTATPQADELPGIDLPQEETGEREQPEQTAMFYLDLETGQIVHQELSKDEDAETSGELDQAGDSQEALRGFAVALEKSLAAAMKDGQLGAKRQKPGDDAIQRINELLRGFTDPAAALQKVLQRQRSRPRLEQGQVGTTQHQAMKGLYAEHFEEGEDDRKKAPRPHEEL